MTLMKLRGVVKEYPGGVRALQRRRPRRGTRRAADDRRAFGLGQDDAAADHGHARSRDRGRGVDRRLRRRGCERRRAVGAARAPDRLRLSAVLPARRAVGASTTSPAACCTPAFRAHSGASGRARRSSASASDTASTHHPTSSRAARSSARRSPARWSAGRRSCSPTSPPARWTRGPGDSIVELLSELNAAGTTIVVITHDTELAASFPRQVAVRDGQIVATRTRSRHECRSSPPRAGCSRATSSPSARSACARAGCGPRSRRSASRSASLRWSPCSGSQRVEPGRPARPDRRARHEPADGAARPVVLRRS